MRVLAKQHEGLVLRAMAALDESEEPPASRATATVAVVIEIPWPGTYPRTNFTLADYFLRRARIEVRFLVRHKVLNRRDKPIPAGQVADLAELCESYERIVGPLIKLRHKTRSKEMIARVKQGGVPEYKVELDEKTVRRLVFQWKLEHPKGDETEYERRLRAGKGPLVFPNDVAVFYYCGKSYRIADFGRLPLWERTTEETHYFVVEFVGRIVDWFRRRGYMTEADAQRALLQAAEYRYKPKK